MISARPAPNRLPIAGSDLRSRGGPNSASIDEIRSRCGIRTEVDQKMSHIDKERTLPDRMHTQIRKCRGVVAQGHRG